MSARSNKSSSDATHPAGSGRERSIQELINKLGLSFSDPILLDTALTHSSFVNESGRSLPDNERLEFLGDSILGMIVCEYLYRDQPDLPEGDLARIKSEIVSEKTLAQIAAGMELGSYLRMGRGERNSGGITRPSNLEDALEALIGAIYLDQGYERARQFVLEAVGESRFRESGRTLNPKTQLQEYVQKHRRETPLYKVMEESGPDHAREFICCVLVAGEEIARGAGSSRRRAEQAAAEEAFKILRAREKKGTLWK